MAMTMWRRASRLLCFLQSHRSYAPNKNTHSLASPALSRLVPKSNGGAIVSSRAALIPFIQSQATQCRSYSGHGRDFGSIAQELSHGLLSMRKPAEYIITMIYSIPVLAPIRICIETGIFKTLADAATKGKSLSAEELASGLPNQSSEPLDEQSKLERRDFVVRTLRAMRGVGLVDEVEPFVYCANDLTKTIADPSMAAGFELVFDTAFGPRSSMTEMATFARSNNYRHPPSAQDGPYQRARELVDISTFQHYVDKDPLQLSRLSLFMQRVQKDRPHWTEWFPAEALFDQASSRSDCVFFVDVAGGLGHDLSALVRKYSDKKLRFVLQDLPSVIQEGKDQRATAGIDLDERIELSEHNFFQPQPVRPASIYFMHKIIHDWPDSDCVKILSQLRDVMEPDSRILVNDMIIPDEKCALLPAAFDITMLTLHSGQERDQDMWTRLVDKVEGLKIQKFWHPPGGQGEGVVEIVKA